ncbi:MAG: hypothetical protein WB626_08600 [Bacteroidota bacterium]
MRRPFIQRLIRGAVLAGAMLVAPGPSSARAGEEPSLNPPIYIAFLWHMHQPIYWPYESLIQTDQNGRYSYSVVDIHNQRWGPYTSWPRTAVQSGINAGLPHFGAQVSFSGSLIENLNALEAAGNGNFQNWKSHWNAVRTQNTTLGNPRMDMVAFGYHHPLMGLIEYQDIRRQIQAHRQIMAASFAGIPSRGIFPPENAFSPRMIPALADEGIEWVLVDNIHFDRAAAGYPFSTSGNLYEPNKADIRNPDPGDWVQLNGLWAPTRNSARWGRQPHRVEYIDPATGASRKIIAVPTDRYLGNEDGRGGFGALNYEYVMSQLEAFNTDPDHPILIVLHHDGDNYGGGSDAYYNSNFQSFVSWLLANPSRFQCTTVEDYLEMYPPHTADVIHIEDGSWSGADNGDPEFKKWNGDPSAGYSPDRNSWGVITAARNYVATAEQINPSSPNTQNAWRHFLNGEASDYWYWDGSQNGIWDSHPARAANLALPYAQAVTGGGPDLPPPTIYSPQREPYNPGATEWGINQSSDFTVWTYVYDLAGLQRVTLKFRTDLDGVNSASNVHNETYAGGSDVTAWTEAAMTGTVIPSQTNPQPIVKANEYAARISGLLNVLADYYVEAVDSNGNTARSPILHVWVGPHAGSGGSPEVSWTPVAPTRDDTIRITIRNAVQGGKLHWGVNNAGSSWQTPAALYWPAGSALFNGTGPAVESPLAGPDSGRLTIRIGPFNNPGQTVERVAFVIHYNDNTWNNNNGQDFHIEIGGNPPPPQGYLMDGILDSAGAAAATAGGLTLYLDWNGVQLYAATQSAQSQGGDMFIVVADSDRSPVNAMWAKAGSVAAWNAFLGNESTNNWSGWFNSQGGQTTGNGVHEAGTVLEGALNLESTFGRIPPVVYIAVGRYQTQDGGALTGQVPSGNGNGTMEHAEFYAYRLDSALAAPPAPLLAEPADGDSGQPLSPTLRWHPASGATSYGLQAATDSLFGGGFAANLTALADTFRTVGPLAPNTPYYWRVGGRNPGGWGPWSEVRRFTTLQTPPEAVMLLWPEQGAATGDSVRLLWRRGSAGATHYRVDLAVDSTFAGAQSDSGLTDTSRTFASLAHSRTYWWRVRARNGAGWGTWSDTRRFTVLAGITTVQVPCTPGWNLRSNPVIRSDDSVRSLYPGSVFPHAFRFLAGAGYLPDFRMEQGAGYWLKFAEAGTALIEGAEAAEDTIGLASGWNLVGSVSDTADTLLVLTIPDSIRASSFFGYEGSYAVAPALLPGRGYWVKAHAPGLMVIRAQARAGRNPGARGR